MVKYTAINNYTRLQQQTIISQLNRSQDPIAKLQSMLFPSNLLLDLYDKDYIKDVKNILNTALSQAINQPSTLVTLLRIKFELMKNPRYQITSEDDGIIAACLTKCDDMAVIEGCLKIICEYQFLKESKCIYYFIKSFTDHLNAYSNQAYQLLDLFQPHHRLIFKFNINNSIKEVVIDDLESYAHGYHSCWEIAERINSQYELGLSQEDHIFISLCTKIKMMLTADKNTLVRCVMYAQQILTHIYVVLVEIESQVKIPNIFLFPPTYIHIVRDMWQMVLNPNIQVLTQLVALQSIEKMLRIEENNMKNLMKRRVLDDMVKDSSHLIYQVLEETFNFIKGKPSIINQSLLDHKDFLKTLFKIVAQRVTDSREIFAVGESISNYVLQGGREYDCEVIESSGKILLGFEAKEETIMNVIMERVRQKPQLSLPYLKILNFLFSCKYHRQRRDLGLIVRMLADSHIFSCFTSAIQSQPINQPLIIELIKTISNLCSENPLIVQQLQTHSNIITKLLSLVKDPQKLSNKSDDIGSMICLIHHVALKEGVIRQIALGSGLVEFYWNLLSSRQLLGLANQKGSSNIYGNMNRLLSNLEMSEAALNQAIIRTMVSIVKQYRLIHNEAGDLIAKPHPQQISILTQINEVDCVLSNLLKMLDKTKQYTIHIFPKEVLEKGIQLLQMLFLQFNFVLTDLTEEDKSIMHIIEDCKKVLGKLEEDQQKDQEEDEEHQEGQQDIPVEVNEESKGSEDLPNEPIKNEKMMEEELELMSNEEFEEKTGRMIDECIGQLNTIQLNGGFTKIRRLYDLVLNGQYNQQHQDEINMILLLNKFQRYTVYLIKSSDQALSNVSLDRVLGMYRMLEICIEILPQMNNAIILEGLPKLQKISEESQTHYSHSTCSIIKNRELNKQMFMKVLENLSPAHTFIDTYSRLIVKLIAINPSNIQLHQKLNRVIVGPLLQKAKKYLQQIKFQLNAIDHCAIEHMRFLEKTLSEIFCVNELAYKRNYNNLNIYAPINIVICYHYYFLNEGEYSIIEFMGDLNRNILSLLEQAKNEYEDIPSNRHQALKVAILRVIARRTQNFLNWVYGRFKIINLSYEDAETPQKQIQTSYKAYYVHDAIQADLVKVVKATSLHFHKNIDLRNELVAETICSIYNSKFQNNVYHQRQFREYLAELPPIPHMLQLSTQQFEHRVMDHTSQLYNWVQLNLHSKLPGIRKLFQNILCRVSKSFEGELLQPQKQKIWEIQNQISYEITILGKTLFPTLSIKLDCKVNPRKIRITNEDYVSVDIKQSIRKLSNLAVLVEQTIIFYNANKLFMKGNLIIRDYYITGLLEFGECIMNNIDEMMVNGEDILEECNDLTYNLTSLLNEYLSYKRNLQDYQMAKKKESQKQIKKSKRKLKLIKKKKHDQKMKADDSEREEKYSSEKDISSPIKKIKSIKQQQLHDQKNIPLKRVKSSYNLHEIISDKKPYRKYKSKLNKKISQLSFNFVSFVKIALQSSQKYPFLTNNTMQALLKLIISSIGSKKHIQPKGVKKIFEVNPQQLIKPIMRVKLSDNQNKGLFYQICELGIKIVSNQYSKIDNQIIVKRFIFEHLPKKEVILREFKQFLKNQLEENLISIAHIIQVVQVQDHQLKKYTKVQINETNIEDLSNHDNVYVRLKQGVQFHEINTLVDRKRKPSQNFPQDEKPKKTIDFTPEGNTVILIHQIMEAIIRLFIKDIGNIQIQLKQQQTNANQKAIDPINLRMLIQLLQILIRFSPCLIPYIIRYRCKKLIDQEIINQKCPQSKIQLLNELLIDKQPNTQINFLLVVCRVLCPLSLNHLNNLLIDLCLDGHLIHLHPKGNAVTFSSLIRQKVLWEIEKNICQDDSMIKKLSSLNTLTNLMVIRQFSEYCLENNNILTLLHTEYIKAFKKKLPYTHLLLPFFIKPTEVLHELLISLSLDKKTQSQVNIGKCLNNLSIRPQLIPSHFFKRNKFEISWPYNVFGELEIEFEDDGSNDQNEDEYDSDSSDESNEHIIRSNSDIESLQGQNNGDGQEGDESVSNREVEWERNWQIQNQLGENQLDEEQPLSDRLSDRIEIRLQYQPQDGNLESHQEIEAIDEQEIDNDDGIDMEDDSEIDEDNDEDSLSSINSITYNIYVPSQKEGDLYNAIDTMLDISEKMNGMTEVHKVCTNQFRTIRAVFKLSDSKKQADELLYQEYHQLLQVFLQDKFFKWFKFMSLNHYIKFQNFMTTKPEVDPFHPSTLCEHNEADQRRARRVGRIYQQNDFPQNELFLERMINRGENPSLRIQQEHHGDEVPQSFNIIRQNQQQQPNNLNVWLRLQNGNIDFVPLNGPSNFDLGQMEIPEDFDNLPQQFQQAILQSMEREEGQQVHQEEPIQIQHEEQQNHQPNNQQEVIEPYQQHQQQQVNDDAPQERIHQSYRKLSMDHSKKLLKDPIQLLNKNGKNNQKFWSCSDEFLQSILSLIYDLNLNQHTNFPYKLLESLFINSHNSLKILSTILSILQLGPNILFPTHQHFIPKTILPGFSGQVIDDYAGEGFKIVCLKLLHLISILSKQYTIAMFMLENNNQPLNSEVLNKGQGQENFMETIIGLLEYEDLRTNPEIIKLIVDSLNNITNHHFGKTVTSYFEKQKKTPEKESSPMDIEGHTLQLQSDAKIQISDKSMKNLCQALEKNYFRRQNNPKVSNIIMRLCANQKNLNTFIKFFNKAITEVAIKQIEILTQINNHRIFSHSFNFNTESQIVNLLTIISDVLKSIKQRKSKHEAVYQQFAKIISCKQLQQMCELGIQLMSLQNQSTYVFNKVSQVLDCFFIVYQMGMKKNNHIYTKNQRPNIASLGEFPIATSNTNIVKNQQQIVKIGDFNLDEIWNKKISNSVGKSFINSIIRKKLRSNIKNSVKSVFDIPIVYIASQTPHMLEFDNKKSLFRYQIKRIHKDQNYQTLQILLNRQDVFNQSFTEIMSRKPQELRGRIKIQFQDEEGEDVGGLTRQWFQILSKEIFNPNYALFKPSSSGNTYQPSSMSYVNAEHLHYFKFIGRIMGKALHDGYMLDAYFTPAFYKHLLSLPITFLDMEEQDYEYYKSLKWILDNSPIEDYMDLNFTYQFDNFGERKAKELIPGGKDVKVVEYNKIQYVQRVSYAKMALSVKNQIEALLQGFHDLIPHYLVRIFDSKEIQLLISGLPTIDIGDLKANTQLHNYNKNDQIIIWFFEVLQEYNMDLRTSFLQFVTGTSRVPSEGFKGLRGLQGDQKFNIHRYYDTLGLPRAHTCFNQLDLPPYQTKQILRQKLTLAITQGKEGFGII